VVMALWNNILRRLLLRRLVVLLVAAARLLARGTNTASAYSSYLPHGGGGFSVLSYCGTSLCSFCFSLFFFLKKK
jgi:hypothetical protein